MAQGISAQVLQEVLELRTDIHKMDTKLEVHLSGDIKRSIDLDKVCKEVFNGQGLRERVSALESNVQFDDKVEAKKEKFSLDIKSSLIVGALMLIISTVAQLLVTKVF